MEQAKVMAQVEVARKENEIIQAPKAVKKVEISQKVVTGDAMHMQRGLAAQIIEAQGDSVLPVKENQPQLYKTSSPCLPLSIPSLASAKSRPISSQHKK